MISNAISAANLITPNNLLVKSNKDIAVNDVKLEAPKSKKKKVVKLLNPRSAHYCLFVLFAIIQSTFRLFKGQQ